MYFSVEKEQRQNSTKKENYFFLAIRYILLLHMGITCVSWKRKVILDRNWTFQALFSRLKEARETSNEKKHQNQHSPLYTTKVKRLTRENPTVLHEANTTRLPSVLMACLKKLKTELEKQHVQWFLCSFKRVYIRENALLRPSSFSFIAALRFSLRSVLSPFPLIYPPPPFPSFATKTHTNTASKASKERQRRRHVVEALQYGKGLFFP